MPRGTRPMRDTDTGFLDDYDFVVQNASYNFSSEYNSGQTLLLTLEGQAIKDNVGQERRVWYSCGTGWDQRDGLVAVHETQDPNKRFNNQVAVSLFIARLYEIAEANGDQALITALDGDGEYPDGFFDARTFIGLTMRMKQEPYKTVDGAEKSRELPIAVGRGQQVQQPVQAVQQAAPQQATQTAAVAPQQQAGLQAVPSAPTATGNGAATAAGGADPLPQLLALAQSSATHNDFVTQATQVDGWQQYADRIVQATGIWSEVKGANA